MSRITIFEGPDGSGKSTQASIFAEATSACFFHFGPYPRVSDKQFARFHIDAMLPALLGHRDVVLDRAWMSEPIYGAIYRDGANRIPRPSYRMLERLAARCETKVVLCQPPLDRCLETWRKRKGEEYLDTEQQLKDVYELYQRQLRLGHFTDLPLEFWDYTNPDVRPGSKNPRTIAYAGPRWTRATGFLNAPIVLVECPSPVPQSEDNDSAYNFVGIEFGFCSAHAWLTDRLDSGGVPENQLLWLDADSPNLKAMIEAFPRKAVFALGFEAELKLVDIGLPYTIDVNPSFVWCTGQPYNLVDRIKRALDG